MAYIHQKNSHHPDVYVITDTEDLTQDISILQHPEVFEIVDGDIPEDAQGLNYSPDPITE